MQEQQIATSVVDEWQVIETELSVENNMTRETVFALANGYLGVRGSHEERFSGLDGKTAEGTYINGFYDCAEISYTETGYGWPKKHQFMLKVPNGKCVNFSVDGEEFDLFEGKIENYKRSLDFRSGILDRAVDWVSPSGKAVRVSSRRLVSFGEKNLYALQYEITALNFSGRVTLTTALDAEVKAAGTDSEEKYGPGVAGAGGDNLILVGSEQSSQGSLLMHRTRGSQHTVLSAIENSLLVNGDSAGTCEIYPNGQRLEHIYRFALNEGETACLTKYGVYYTSKEHPENALWEMARGALKRASTVGFEVLCAEQERFLGTFWRQADIQITGDPSVQQGSRFSQFHLLQSVGRDGMTSVAAKGLTGEGYGGHYFWDAESYAFPVYLYSKPEIARQMLVYRYSILNQARQRARELAHERGALFAWRTISGEESSSYFPAGTAAYHINADIAYAIKQYFEATDDDEFLLQYGAEIVFETARIWLGIGNYVNSNRGEQSEQFHINEVTGPDEYTALVNNNYYTNAMAQNHLRFAVTLVNKLKREYPAQFERLEQVIGLEADEPKEWQRAADLMYLPYDSRLGIYPQDDSFLSKKKWDLKATPAERRPLALFYHYLVIYRHQVCKQADLVMALFMLGNQFSLAEKKCNFDYYEEITTHDSSLSRCTFSVIASEVGYREKAYSYFVDRLRGDLDNQYSDCAHGVHIAAMAGNWMAIVNGFGGMRVYDGQLQFNPYLPAAWQQYSFRINFKGQILQVEVDSDAVTYRLVQGEGVRFTHQDVALEITKARPLQVVLRTEPIASAAIPSTGVYVQAGGNQTQCAKL